MNYVADTRDRPLRAPEIGRRTAALIAAESLVRIGIAAALADTHAVLQAQTAAAGRRLLSVHQPDLAVLVLSPPLADAPLEETCVTLLGGDHTTPALVLVRPEDGAAVRLAARYGAKAIYDTLLPVDTLRALVIRLDSAAPAVQPSLMHFLMERDTPEGGATAVALGPRELAALQLLARGYTSKQIAGALGATPKAVDLLIERATQRLGASHRTQAVAIAARRGLLAPA